MSSFLQNKIFWFLAFGLLFALSLDFWRRDAEISLSYFGLPEWLYYFFWLQIALAGVLFFFVKTYWRRRPPQSRSARS